MGDALTFKNLVKAYPNRFVICTVDSRDEITKRAKTFSVLQTVKETEEMKKAVEHHQKKGVNGVVIAIPTFLSDETPVFSAKYVALLFRTLYHD